MGKAGSSFVGHRGDNVQVCNMDAGATVPTWRDRAAQSGSVYAGLVSCMTSTQCRIICGHTASTLSIMGDSSPTNCASCSWYSDTVPSSCACDGVLPDQPAWRLVQPFPGGALVAWCVPGRCWRTI